MPQIVYTKDFESVFNMRKFSTNSYPLESSSEMVRESSTRANHLYLQICLILILLQAYYMIVLTYGHTIVVVIFAILYFREMLKNALKQNFCGF